jgi:hypothetical protein
MNSKMSKEIKQELTMKGVMLVKFAADLATAFVMLLLIAESARISEEVISALTAATHDSLMGFVLSTCHVIVMGFDAVAFVWVGFKSLQRFIKSLK